MTRTNHPIANFGDFWLHYLREHAQPWTRLLHYAGTGCAVTAAAASLVSGNLLILLGVPLAGYGPAWIAHLFVEKNRPATFTYPLWSLAADFRMTFRWLTGRIESDLANAGVIEHVARKHR